MGGKRGCRYRVTGMDFVQIKNQVPPKLQILAKKRGSVPVRTASQELSLCVAVPMFTYDMLTYKCHT